MLTSFFWEGRGRPDGDDDDDDESLSILKDIFFKVEKGMEGIESSSICKEFNVIGMDGSIRWKETLMLHFIKYNNCIDIL